MNMDEMKMMAERTVHTALSAGAKTAEVAVVESTEFEVSVRKERIETLMESVSSSIGITVSFDKRKASVTSSDLSEASVNQIVTEAVELARVMDRDEYLDLPEPQELGSYEGDLRMFDPETVQLPAEEKIKIAFALEKSALSMDKRIISDGGSLTNGMRKIAFANSAGFCNGYSRTFNALSISCAAEEEARRGENVGKKQSSYWYSAASSFKDLESIEAVASKAVSRTLRKLGAAKPRTCEVPVIFDPETARSFLSSIAAAVNGGNIYMKASFLVDKTGERIGSPPVTIVDDPLLLGKLGTRPFDSEGVRSRKNIVVERGVLNSYLLSSYQARKLGLQTTGNAGGSSNFYMEPGELKPEEIIASVREGLYLISLFGPGANHATGDFSQGAQGIWIEKGELSYPVDEFTIASTFQEMLKGIVSVGNDIDWNSPTAAPTFKLEKMTISGT